MDFLLALAWGAALFGLGFLAGRIYEARRRPPPSGGNGEGGESVRRAALYRVIVEDSGRWVLWASEDEPHAAHATAVRLMYQGRTAQVVPEAAWADFCARYRVTEPAGTPLGRSRESPRSGNTAGL